MQKIDFAIVGQPKSGTTALAQFLSEHPEICMSYPKEPNYFATDLAEESEKFHGKQKYFLTNTENDYSKHFSGCSSTQIIGEASTNYLYSRVAAKKIYKHNPDAKIIIMLRNPVNFMHSLHMQYVNEATENEIDFEKALELEEKRKKGQAIPRNTRCPSFHLYRERAKYYEQLERFFNVFPRKQIFVTTMEEFMTDNESAYKEVLSFLKANIDFEPDFKRVHESKSPRFFWLNKLAHTAWVKKTAHKVLGPRLYTKIQKKISKILLKKSPRQDMNKKLKSKLTKEFEPEVIKLSKLLNKDLVSIWGFRETKL